MLGGMSALPNTSTSFPPETQKMGTALLKSVWTGNLQEFHGFCRISTESSFWGPHFRDSGRFSALGKWDRTHVGSGGLTQSRILTLVNT